MERRRPFTNSKSPIGRLRRLLGNKIFDFDKWAAEIEALGDELLPVCNAETGLGFHASGANKMNEISRSLENLVAQVVGENHQCPDGLVLSLGTMFAPTENRDANSNGFTHKIGDKVIISFPKLGQLINWVNTCDQLPRWEFGIHSFIDFCIKRAAC